MKKRTRDCAHLWADKRILRAFRHIYDRREAKNLRNVYIALCEIDSDFNETPLIKSFIKTVCTYTGMDKDTVGPIINKLEKLELIGRYQEHSENGTWGNTRLELYIFEDSKLRLLEKRLTGKTVNGKTGRFKNNTKVLTSSKKEKDRSLESWGDVILKRNQSNSPRKRIKPLPIKQKQTKKTEDQSFLYMFPKEVKRNLEFRQAFCEFEESRREQKKPLTEIAAKRLVNKLKPFTIEEQIEALNDSVIGQYTGVFPKKKFTQSKNKRPQRGVVCSDFDKYEKAAQQGRSFKGGK